MQLMLTWKNMARIVYPQTPERIFSLAEAHLKKEFAKLQSKNSLTITKASDGMPWVTKYEHWNYMAASRATEVCLLSFLMLVVSLYGAD